MDISMTQVGSTLTNGSSALRITERVQDGPGWRGYVIPLEWENGMTVPVFGPVYWTIPDERLDSWSHVPFEWTPLPGAATEHRYVWSDDWTWLRYETRASSAYDEALRENWARDQVARAGKSWRTHTVKFGGAVVPREAR